MRVRGTRREHGPYRRASAATLSPASCQEAKLGPRALLPHPSPFGLYIRLRVRLGRICPACLSTTCEAISPGTGTSGSQLNATACCCAQRSPQLAGTPRTAPLRALPRARSAPRSAGGPRRALLSSPLPHLLRGHCKRVSRPVRPGTKRGLQIYHTHRACAWGAWG